VENKNNLAFHPRPEAPPRTDPIENWRKPKVLYGQVIII